MRADSCCSGRVGCRIADKKERSNTVNLLLFEKNYIQVGSTWSNLFATESLSELIQSAIWPCSMYLKENARNKKKKQSRRSKVSSLDHPLLGVTIQEGEAGGRLQVGLGKIEAWPFVF